MQAIGAKDTVMMSPIFNSRANAVLLQEKICLVDPAIVICQRQATLKVRGTCSVQKLADNDSRRAIGNQLFCKYKQVMYYSCWCPSETAQVITADGQNYYGVIVLW